MLLVLTMYYNNLDLSLTFLDTFYKVYSAANKSLIQIFLKTEMSLTFSSIKNLYDPKFTLFISKLWTQRASVSKELSKKMSH